NAVAYGNGMFVCAGGLSIVLMHSTNGVEWVVDRDSIGVDQFFGLTYANGKFVAVGVNSLRDRGAIETSADGIHWTVRTSGTSNWLNAVTYGGGLYAAVGDT